MSATVEPEADAGPTSVGSATTTSSAAPTSNGVVGGHTDTAPSDTRTTGSTSPAVTGTTKTGRCDSTVTGDFTSTSGTADFTSTSGTADFTSTSGTADSTSTNVAPTSGTTATGDTDSTQGLCTPDGWCSEHLVSARYSFNAISRDGKYASETNGIVFELPHQVLPSSPTRNPGYVETSGTGVWLGNADGLFHYDGSKWTQSNTAPVVALTQSSAGTTWALLGSGEEYSVQRLVDSEWVSEALPEGALGLDAIAVDDDTVWVLTGTPAEQWRTGIENADLTLYELTSGSAVVLSNTTALQTASPRFSRVGDTIYVHDNGGLTQDIYDPLDWHIQAVKPPTAIGLYETPDGRFLTNVWPGLYTFNEGTGESVFSQLCDDVAVLDSETLLCAVYYGGLVRIRVPAR